MVAAATSKESVARAEALDRLAKRVSVGQVAFFVGAGFSIDSEGNTASRLARRLLIRLRALLGATRGLHDELVAESAQEGRDGQASRRLKDVRVLLEGLEAIAQDLVANFDAPGFTPQDLAAAVAAHDGKDDPCLHQKLVEELTRNYYEANSWFCGAFDHVLALLRSLSVAPGGDAILRDLLEKVRQSEEEMRAEQHYQDQIALHPIDPALIDAGVEDLSGNDHARGKALFLDTLGFFDCPGVMGGDAYDDSTHRVLAAYRQKLLPRHWVLARFAREGWCPIVLTTNFDRLLEGAFRLSGFFPTRPGAEQQKEPEGRTPVPIPAWSTIAAPSDFVAFGAAVRRALVVKIHGCSWRYSQVRRGAVAEWQTYLRSLVFTYREIQNWREDSWSRDYVRTILRTRTLAFCGYSTRDPVIHDTLRSVYEEMERDRRRAVRGANGAAAGEAEFAAAPAYFLASRSDDRREFYGNEVLRAASAAHSGTAPRQGALHPNYLSYYYRSGGKFPNVDDCLLWVNHLTYRDGQLAALQRELRRVTATLLVAPKRQSWINDVVKRFAAQVEEERRAAERWSHPAVGRRELNDLARWTYSFHPNLLREFAYSDAAQRNVGDSEALLEMMAMPAFYFPTTAQPAWTAWAVVVELALRNMAGRLGGPAGEIIASDAKRPTVLLPPSNGRLVPVGLTICFAGLERRGVSGPARDGARRRLVWELPATASPWPAEPPSRAVRGAGVPMALGAARGRRASAPEFLRVQLRAPDARTICDLAVDRVDLPDIEALLGLDSAATMVTT